MPVNHQGLRRLCMYYALYLNHTFLFFSICATNEFSSLCCSRVPCEEIVILGKKKIIFDTGWTNYFHLRSTSVYTGRKCTFHYFEFCVKILLLRMRNVLCLSLIVFNIFWVFMSNKTSADPIMIINFSYKRAL